MRNVHVSRISSETFLLSTLPPAAKPTKQKPVQVFKRRLATMSHMVTINKSRQNTSLFGGQPIKGTREQTSAFFSLNIKNNVPNSLDISSNAFLMASIK